MPESLGEKLRAAREARGLTVEQLATVTRINPSFILALESGRWDLLPGRVYLWTFTKACAEALDLNAQELYERIGGLSEEKKQAEYNLIEPPAPKKKLDYKLPLVGVSMLVIVGLIAFVAKSDRFGQRSAKTEPVISARVVTEKHPPQWNRVWEHPPMQAQYAGSQRFRLEAKDNVWVCVIADNDTAFVGIMPAKSTKIFRSQKGFIVSLGRNDKVIGYLNGVKVPEIGKEKARLTNLALGSN